MKDIRSSGGCGRSTSEFPPSEYGNGARSTFQPTGAIIL